MTGGQDKPLLRVLRGETLPQPPWWLMRQAGRYLPEYHAVRARARDFINFCLTPELAAEATLQPVRRFGMDAAILFADILLVPSAMGQRVRFGEAGPVLDPVSSVSSLRLGNMSGLEPVYETVRLVRAALPPEVALIGFAGAPWTVAAYMVEGGGSRDFSSVRTLSYGDPEGFASLLELIVETTVAYLTGQIAAGAEVVQLFDSWAGILPEAGFERWVIAPTRRITAALKQRFPDVPVIGFPRGAGLFYDRYAAETGVDAVSLDTAVPAEFARRLQTKIAVQGNLDPALLVVGGSALAASVLRLRQALGDGPFVFNLGHGVLPQTPPENVAVLAELLRAPMPSPMRR